MENVQQRSNYQNYLFPQRRVGNNRKSSQTTRNPQRILQFQLLVTGSVSQALGGGQQKRKAAEILIALGPKALTTQRWKLPAKIQCDQQPKYC